MTASIALQSVLLRQSAPVELWVLDLTPLGGPVQRIAGQVNELKQPIVWQGQSYAPMAVQANGFERRAGGTFPRPTLAVGNVLGILGGLLRQYDRLRGAFVTRKRTMAMYLDAANFAGGNTLADPDAHWPDELWRIDRCPQRDNLAVAWELRNPIDFDGVLLPGRLVRSNHCPWGYRSSSCGYTGAAVAKADDSPTTDLGQDRCGKRLSSCKLRFPAPAVLPFGGFPGVGVTRSA